MESEQGKLTGTGKEVCNALGTLLVGAVSSRFTDYEPVDEEVAEEYVHEVIAEHGFERIASGLGRAVYRVPGVYHTGSIDLVVKFARPAADEMNDPRNGINQNDTESSLWETVQGTGFSEFFAPVLDAHEDGHYVVMPEYDLDEDETGVKRARNRLDDAPWKPEIDTGEIAVVDGRPVVIDYGIVNDRW